MNACFGLKLVKRVEPQAMLLTVVRQLLFSVFSCVSFRNSGDTR